MSICLRRGSTWFHTFVLEPLTILDTIDLFGRGFEQNLIGLCVGTLGRLGLQKLLREKMAIIRKKSLIRFSQCITKRV